MSRPDFNHLQAAILWPKLSQVPSDYRDLKVEISINHGLIDIVAERFDAGVRSGGQVAIQEALDGVNVVWLEKVTDAEYLAGPSR